MKKPWTTGKILGTIFGCFGIGVALIVSFMVSVYQITDFIMAVAESEYFEAEYDEDRDEDFDEDRADDRDNDYDDDRDDDYDDDYTYGGEDDDDVYNYFENEYYEFEDAVRDDLSYRVEFDTYEKDDFMEDSGYISMDVTYPVVYGDSVDEERVNDAIQGEIGVVEDYLDDIADYLGGGEYTFTAYAYVTYMSEEVLSVAYVEYAYLDGDYFESYVVPVNIDMETGMVLKNSQFFSVDDDFSIEFRKRCERQNGIIDSISDMSDQEITEYLSDESTVIAFYTPLGMEIGFNYYDGWVTVTYSDYKKYQQQF